MIGITGNRLPMTPNRPSSHCGDYQTLLSYQKSEIIYQMVQAARSGKQNIVEGSKAATTSKEMAIKLTNVARASAGAAAPRGEEAMKTSFTTFRKKYSAPQRVK